MLSQEERNDLRRKVLAGQALTLDEAREVCESVRGGAGAAQLLNEDKPKRKKGDGKPALSDEALEADLANLGL